MGAKIRAFTYTSRRWFPEGTTVHVTLNVSNRPIRDRVAQICWNGFFLDQLHMLLVGFYRFSSASPASHQNLEKQIYTSASASPSTKKGYISPVLSLSFSPEAAATRATAPRRRRPPVLGPADTALLPPPSSLSPALSLSSDVVACQPAPATPDGRAARCRGDGSPACGRSNARGPRWWPSPRSAATPRTPVSTGAASPALPPPSGKKP